MVYHMLVPFTIHIIYHILVLFTIHHPHAISYTDPILPFIIHMVYDTKPRRYLIPFTDRFHHAHGIYTMHQSHSLTTQALFPLTCAHGIHRNARQDVKPATIRIVIIIFLVRFSDDKFLTLCCIECP